MKTITLELIDAIGDPIWISLRKHGRGVQVRWWWDNMSDTGTWFRISDVAPNPGLLRPCIPLIRAAAASLTKS